MHGELTTENVWYAAGIPGTAVTTLSVPELAPLVREAQLRSTVDRVGAPLAPVAHLAPEILMGKPEGLAVDVWSFALLVYELLVGAPYWRALRDQGSFSLLLTEIVAAPIAPASERAKEGRWAGALPSGFDAWFATCLVRDPTARPSMRAALESLRAVFASPVAPVIEPEVLMGNPKGSFYDRGLDPFGGAQPHKPEILMGNPKGSFYDRGLDERPKRRWRYAVGAALAVAGAALGAWLASR